MRRILFLILTILPVWSQAQTVRCAHLHGELSIEKLRSEFIEKLTASNQVAALEILGELKNLDREVIYGKKTPTWENFETLQAIQFNLKQFVQALRESQGEKAVQQFFQELNLIEARFSEVRRTGNSNNIPADTKYGPIDHGLRLAFREEVLRLNRQLPVHLRFKVKDLPADKMNAELIQVGKEVVEAQTANIDRLMPLDGYESVKDLAEKIRSSGSQQVRENLERLEKEDFEFAIARPENARWWIPKVGFHNQHVTGSSGGYMGSLGRNAVEASMLGVELQDFQHQSNALKPKYGWLVPRLNSGGLARSVHYGTDMFILDKTKMRDRTTFTIGDSLDAFSDRSGGGWRRGETKASTHWSELFVPWSQRAILAPALKHNPLTPPHDETFFVGEGLPNLKITMANSSYYELQFWGPLDLSHVKAFVFGNSPPSGEFLAALRARRIPIYKDMGDQKTYELWKEPTP